MALSWSSSIGGFLSIDWTSGGSILSVFLSVRVWRNREGGDAWFNRGVAQKDELRQTTFYWESFPILLMLDSSLLCYSYAWVLFVLEFVLLWPFLEKNGPPTISLNWAPFWIYDFMSINLSSRFVSTCQYSRLR